ncbi:MAG: lipoyl synthase [Candidatus Binatia bacterium]
MLQRGGSHQSPRKPPWLRVSIPSSPRYGSTGKLFRGLRLNTVCEEAACPNMGECWAEGHATVMILGRVCTRACGFCNVSTGRPGPVDSGEPERLADAVAELQLRHVVITSVDRDDLPDGGAQHFVRCIEAVRARCPTTSIEVLTPDFLRKPRAGEAIAGAMPDVFNHNLETVARLYPRVRKAADYRASLDLLGMIKGVAPGVFTKSGIMVGLGERFSEVLALMDDLRGVKVDFITIGQYLQPTRAHLPVERYVHPAEFDAYAEAAREKGFFMVAASPLTRSSYHAGADFQRLKSARAELRDQAERG